MVIATFNGRHNRVKSTVFILLYNYQSSWHDREHALTVRKISDLTGCNYGSLLALVIRWRRWGYVLSKKTEGASRYILSTRGRHFVEIRIPQSLRNELEGEIMVRLKNPTNFPTNYS